MVLTVTAEPAVKLLLGENVAVEARGIDVSGTVTTAVPLPKWGEAIAATTETEPVPSLLCGTVMVAEPSVLYPKRLPRKS